MSDIISDYPTIQVLEARYLEQVLTYTNGNKSKASKILGVSQSTLWRRIKESH
jgi:DNA-binding protein Fis